jgi:hypothetical protein
MVTSKLRLRDLTANQRKAMFLAEELRPALPDDFEVLVAEQRPRTMTRKAVQIGIAA